MRVDILYLCLALAAGWRATAQDGNTGATPSAACIEFNQNIVTKLDRGQLTEAEASLSAALNEKENNFEPSCLALTLHNMANVLALSGRLAEGEVFVERSTKLYAKLYPLEDPRRFRPLHLLWSVQFQRRERGKARQTFQAMRALRLDKPHDRAILHAAAASELQADGRYEEAEREYLKAFAESKAVGRGESGELAILLCALGTLQFFQGRYPEAGTTLDSALAVANSAKDAVPMDRIKILSVRGALRARQTKWQAAAEDFRSAISIADRDARLDPAQLKILLGNFEFVLRKARRGKEAGFIEARAAAIRDVPLTNAIVDVSDLSEKTNGGRNRKR